MVTPRTLLLLDTHSFLRRGIATRTVSGSELPQQARFCLVLPLHSLQSVCQFMHACSAAEPGSPHPPQGLPNLVVLICCELTNACACEMLVSVMLCVFMMLSVCRCAEGHR